MDFLPTQNLPISSAWSASSPTAAYAQFPCAAGMHGLTFSHLLSPLVLMLIVDKVICPLWGLSSKKFLFFSMPERQKPFREVIAKHCLCSLTGSVFQISPERKLEKTACRGSPLTPFASKITDCPAGVFYFFGTNAPYMRVFIFVKFP